MLAAIAILLTIAVLVGQMVGRPGPPQPDPPAASGPPATGPQATGPQATSPGNAGQGAAWAAIGGARVEPAGTVPAGRRAGVFTPTGQGDQGMVLAEVAWCAPGRVYAATLRVRASQPGALVQVTLLEVMGGRRLAADTIGAVLHDRGWRQVEVAHEGQRPGAALAVEVVLPRGSPRATVQVGDLTVETSQAHQLRSGR